MAELRLTPKAWFTTGEIGRRFGMSRQTVIRLIEAGRLEGEKLPNGRWRIPADAIINAPDEERIPEQ